MSLDRSKKYASDSNKDKAVMFFSASSYKDALAVLDSGINDILTSYHYIMKREKGFTEDVMPRIKANGGLFMTDSGAFTFFAKPTPEMYTEEYWEPYIEEYVKFLRDNAHQIYCAANMDIDIFVGQEIVDRWNKKYFEPLKGIVQIVYIVHGNKAIRRDDEYGIKRFKEYAAKYEYLGMGSSMFKKNSRSDNRYYALARLLKVRLHGFGWTSIPSLKEFPFFSVDSTTWLGGVRYGTTYTYDGANDRVLDHKKKFRRKGMKSLCKDLGINHENLLLEKRDEINALNLYGWKGFRFEFLKAANTKLKYNPARSYAKYLEK
jgi:hypothetical protein